jgi:hypothetical protein
VELRASAETGILNLEVPKLLVAVKTSPTSRQEEQVWTVALPLPSGWLHGCSSYALVLITRFALFRKIQPTHCAVWFFC